MIDCFCIMLFCISLITTVVGIHGDLYIFANESVDFPEVSTTSGQFAGFTIRETNVWIGIPYAAPPVGEIRWQKAQPYVITNEQNNTIQNATHYSPWCPQIAREGFTSSLVHEDCLYLNVWAPRTPSALSTGYPVMIWIHGGGGFLEGSATQVAFDGLSWTNAAIESNNSFIMVSINYRLNVMGFFAQSSLFDDNGKMIANQGITDQRAAINWIRENIKQFGGDKNSITLMGQSAGSQSICIHIVSPLSTNLFKAGILESGTCDTLPYLRDSQFAYSTANELAFRVGCNMTNSIEQLTCLRAVDSALLVAVAANVSIPSSNITAFKDRIGFMFPFSLILDEVEIPVHPLQAFLSGKFNRIPILIGANQDEFLLQSLYEKLIDGPTSVEDYLTRVLPAMTYNNSHVQELYNPSKFDGNYKKAFVALASQVKFLCSARRMAGYMTGQSTYLYSYNHALNYSFYSRSSLVIGSGAFHTAELFGLFQTLTDSLHGSTIFKPDELDLMTSIRDYWTNMITKGQPNDKVTLTWPQYVSTTDQAIMLNKNITTDAFINIYPNCDILSAVEVEIFGKYLGINATCNAGNKCFIIDSHSSTEPTVTTMSTSTSTSTTIITSSTAITESTTTATEFTTTTITEPTATTGSTTTATEFTTTTITEPTATTGSTTTATEFTTTTITEPTTITGSTTTATEFTTTTITEPTATTGSTTTATEFTTTTITEPTATTGSTTTATEFTTTTITEPTTITGSTTTATEFTTTTITESTTNAITGSTTTAITTTSAVITESNSTITATVNTTETTPKNEGVSYFQLNLFPLHVLYTVFLLFHF